MPRLFPRWPARFTAASTLSLLALSTHAFSSADAQSNTAISGPPAPAAPATINRDAAGRTTVRALKLEKPLSVDGVLDEDVYQREQPFDGMMQVAPNAGEPATERSDIWITYDNTHIYVSCKCYDKSPEAEWVVNELRRDTGGLRNNEHFGVMFDTFYDRRSGFAFYTNPLGARADYSVVDEGGSNTDWNPVWTAKSARFDGGWSVELAIPFKSLRYRAGKDQVWGVQLRRSIRHKNEWDYLTPVPRIMAGPQALNKVSAAGTLVGLDLPEAGKNIELKPYIVSRVTTDRVKTPTINDKFGSEVGGDIKYALTPNLTADLTVNTDFAQVEIDEQQVNLTRFSLFFPEKREFFLEGRGIFDFGKGGNGAFGNSGGTDVPDLFYTRRIGLNNGGVVHINGGGRLTGKVGKYAIGLMNVGTARDAPTKTAPTNFTVLRLKRDILQRSSLGVMATSRSVAASGTGTNQAYGADAAFLLSQALTAGAYWAQSATTGLSGNNQSYQGRVDYSVDRYGIKTDFLSVGKNFDPQVGFRRRADFNRSFAELRFSPRPKNQTVIRKFTYTGSGEYFENSAGTVETRILRARAGVEFASSDLFNLDVTRDYEFLRTPFTPSGSPAAIPAGGYDFSDVALSYQFGAQRRVSGTISGRVGNYYDGTIRALTFGAGSTGSTARVAFSKRFALEPTYSITRIERPNASFTTRLARARMDYGFTPLMFASGLVQYNSADRAFSTNLRFRWEYAPGSELFVVYADERDVTDDPHVTPTTVRGLKNRTFVVKFTRLFRY
ncbi:MAG: carbohydrate binding family 9 domain-containing protein [Gemmatimonadaceae bacterium]|nr:carbohydrate binding family 9 domain-containing protein [Gemmatimonadaceae bacterium]